jgi:predicted MPP superfamily phosphohydrolase
MSWLFLFVLVAIIVGDVFWWRYAMRLVRPLRHAFWWRLLVRLFMGGQLALVVWILGGRFLPESAWSRPPQLLSAAAYIWHLIILPILLTLVSMERLLLWARRLGRRLAGLRSPEALRQPKPKVESALAQELGLGGAIVPADGGDVSVARRQFLSRIAVLTPALLTGGGAVYSVPQLQRLRIRPVTVAYSSLPPELDGLRIALVSDLHVGTFTDSEAVRRIVADTNQLRADLVLLPGDLVNNSLADLSDALDAVAAMDSRYGSYLCLGNHDLIDNGPEFVRRAKARVPLLVNESQIVPVRGQQIQLLGLPWSSGDDRIANSVQELSRQLIPGTFPILLAHHPHAFDTAAAAGIPLTVSGHTHGGQLMVSEAVGFGPLLFRYWSGLYRKPEHPNSALVVSNGVGHWFPVRTGAPAEIILLTLSANPVGEN